MNVETDQKYTSDLLKKIFTPILLCLGLAGNLISIVIFSQRSMRKYSTFRYLTLLSIVDLCTLYTGCSQIMIMVYFKIDFRLINDFTCKIQSFLVIFFTHFSSMLLAMMSIDRTVAITLKVGKKFSTPRTAFQMFFLLAIMLTLVNLHFLIFVNLEEYKLPTNNKQIEINNINNNNNYNNYNYNNVNADNLDNSNTNINGNSYSYSDYNLNNLNSSSLSSSVISSIYSYSEHTESEPVHGNENFVYQMQKLINPSSTNNPNNLNSNYINVTNITFDYEKGVDFYLIKMCTASIENKFYYGFLGNIFPWVDLFFYAIFPFAIMCVCSIVIIIRIFNSSSSSLVKNGKISKNRSTRNKQLFYILLTTNCLFICLVSPLVLLNVLDMIQEDTTKTTIAYILSYANHGLNFIFYGISCQKYRKEFFQILKCIFCCKCKNSADKKYEIVTTNYNQKATTKTNRPSFMIH